MFYFDRPHVFFFRARLADYFLAIYGLRSALTVLSYSVCAVRAGVKGNNQIVDVRKSLCARLPRQRVVHFMHKILPLWGRPPQTI